MIKAALRTMARNRLIGGALDASLVRAAGFLRSERDRGRVEELSLEAIRAHCPNLTVRHGPFRGLQYPGADSVASSLFPKLLGSYEAELHPTIERLCAKPYKQILDVGCAEGYYAVGLAKRIPTAHVIAYDTDPRARQLCEAMAALNGVKDRIVTRGLCDPSDLRSLAGRDGVLIVCDCEGCERDLFDPHTVEALRGADVLIEVHDLLDPTISGTLRAAFANTHSIASIESIDDLKKARTYNYPELSDCDLKLKRVLLGEYRHATMEWFHASPRTRP